MSRCGADPLASEIDDRRADDRRADDRRDDDRRVDDRTGTVRRVAADPAALRRRLPRDATWRSDPAFDAETAFATVRPDPPPVVRLLAVAARTRGVTTPADEALRAVVGTDSDETAETPTADSSGLRAAREAVAEAAATVDERRERVAKLRGRLKACREVDGDTEAVGADLETAMRSLTEAETTHLAARERLAAARRRARETRDAYERSLSQHDARRNRAREARRTLAASVVPLVGETLECVTARTGRGPARLAGGLDSTTEHECGDEREGVDAADAADAVAATTAPRSAVPSVDGDVVAVHLAALAVATVEEPVLVLVDDLDPETVADFVDATVVVPER